jgi:hypothetical protein
MEDVSPKEPESLVRGTTSGSTTKQLFLERKPRPSKSLMRAFSVNNEASEEEIITRLHSLIIVDPEAELNFVEAGPSRLTNSDFNPPHTSRPSSKQERRHLRVDTQLSYALYPPPRVAVESANRLSTTTTTSEPELEETGSRRAIRSVTSLPSFHLPHRSRSGSYGGYRISVTPPLTSASLSSLTSGGSPTSQISGLHTPPHSPPGYTSVHTENTTPSLSHLSPISELQSTEYCIQRRLLQPREGESTQTITRTNPPGPSSMVRSESNGQGQAIVPHNTLYSLPYYSKTTDSLTDTVTGLVLHSSSPPPSLSIHSRLQPQLPTPPSASPSPSPLLSVPGTSNRAWPFGGGIYRSSSSSHAGSVLSLNSSSKALKAEKAAEKKRRKAEARAEKDRRALELKNRGKSWDGASTHSSRSTERVLNPRPWEEDIAVYGSLASM